MKSYALITGASSGIGRELAVIAARENHNLILVARSEDKLQVLAEELKTGQIDIQILAINLSAPSAAQDIYAFCRRNKLRIDTLINNAGFGDYGDFAHSNLGRQREMIDLNIRTLTELTHLLLPQMLVRGEGKILNLGSVASFLPGPLMSVYFASKAYVLSFSQALAEELRGTGVSVTCLCPGPTQSNFGKVARVGNKNAITTAKVTAAEVAGLGWHALQAGKTVAIYGFGNKIAIQLIKFTPRNLLARIIKKQQR